jgi:putative redox protein
MPVTKGGDRAIGGKRRCNIRRLTEGGTMKTRVRWVERVEFVAESGSGHALVIDGSPEAGGRNLGMRPMELVLAGAAGCTAFDVVWILKRARQPIADCVVDAEAERAPVEPKVFTRIHLRYAVAGRGLDPRQVERAVKLSKEKYCSATIMLARSAEITYDVRIIDGDRVADDGATTSAGATAGPAAGG